MNEKIAPTSGPEQYKSLQILDELSNNDSLTQRDLSSRLGIALGLVNSYIKNLIAKGYITVKSIPPKRYAYYLTPKGFAEKTRLTYDLLQDYNRIYREARRNVKELFNDLQANNIKKIVFAGADEVAEIAYITLQETNLQLAGVVDDVRAGKTFFGRVIQPVYAVLEMDYDSIVITSYVTREALHNGLREKGVDDKKVRVLFR